MAEPRELLAGFATDLEAGRDPDPREWIDRAPEAERQELAAMIDSYLMKAPRRAWDPVAFDGSLAKLAVERAYESVEGVSGSWPELLPRLRTRAQVKRSELVARLATAIGAGSGQGELEKVGGYYHRMEHGLLPAAGVSERVIEALATIVDASAEAIRAAGEADAAASGQASPAVGAAATYTRVTESLESRLISSADAEPPAADDAGRGEPAGAKRDAIDELFTGGPDAAG